MDLATRVRYRSLESWYLADGGKPSRRHACWQSPFALYAEAGDRADRERRIQLAGDIWLRNFDLRFYGQLWMFDDVAATTWVFRRCREPGGRHIRLGPIADVAMSAGRQLFGLELRYRESDDPAHEQLLRSLLARRR